jgi:hypothetical protein
MVASGHPVARPGILPSMLAAGLVCLSIHFVLPVVYLLLDTGPTPFTTERMTQQPDTRKKSAEFFVISYWDDTMMATNHRAACSDVAWQWHACPYLLLDLIQRLFELADANQVILGSVKPIAGVVQVARIPIGKQTPIQVTVTQTAEVNHRQVRVSVTYCLTTPVRL